MAYSGALPASSSAPEPTPSRAAFAFVFIAVALDMLALGVMVSVLPKLIVELEHGHMTSAANVQGIFGFRFLLALIVAREQRRELGLRLRIGAE